MRNCLLAFAVLVTGTLAPVIAMAEAKKGTCPGGMSACIQRCYKGGGQPRLCPSYCQKQRGC